MEFFKLIIFFSYLLLSDTADGAESFRDLDYTQRPAAIQEKIESIFNNIETDTVTSWLHQGSKSYDLCNIDDHFLVDAIIDEHPEQKQFHFFDVGGGDHRWALALYEHILTRIEQKSVQEDVTFTIVSARGEHDNETVLSTHSRITIKNIGSFKIEETEKELHKHNVSSPFDLIVSRWTLRHLVDPAGTFVQLYNRLSPKGLLCADGFFIDYPEKPFENKANENMFALLANIGEPFLMSPYSCGRSMDQWMLQRTKKEPLSFALSYATMRSIGSRSQCNAETVLSFIQNEKWISNVSRVCYSYQYITWYKKEKTATYYGTLQIKQLLDWLQNAQFIISYKQVEDDL